MPHSPGSEWHVHQLCFLLSLGLALLLDLLLDHLAVLIKLLLLFLDFSLTLPSLLWRSFSLRSFFLDLLLLLYLNLDLLLSSAFVGRLCDAVPAVLVDESLGDCTLGLLGLPSLNRSLVLRTAIGTGYRLLIIKQVIRRWRQVRLDTLLFDDLAFRHLIRQFETTDDGAECNRPRRMKRLCRYSCPFERHSDGDAPLASARQGFPG